MPRFKTILLKEAADFIAEQPEEVQDKIIYNIRKVAGGKIDPELFKKLDGTKIWEFRTKYFGNEYRLLAFWDTRSETIVVATHGFSKKTQKTPSREIAHAEDIRVRYLNKKA